MKKLIDLSTLVENSPSEPLKMAVDRLDHRQGAQKFCQEVRERVSSENLNPSFELSPDSFPDASFLSLDIVTMPTHMGTHVDAPIHYGPTCDGYTSRSVDELPLDWFFAPAVKLDLRHKQAGEFITTEDLKDAVKASEYKLQAHDIVLIWTGIDKLWGKKEYFSNAPGMSREATKWLVEQGIKVIGIDTYGFDRPFMSMLKDYWSTGDSKYLWPAHFYGREREYIQIERLVNLDLLPNKGFYISCFPLRIKGLDASWVRAVAIVELDN
jgi:kynurenine formamidase